MIDFGVDVDRIITIKTILDNFANPDPGHGIGIEYITLYKESDNFIAPVGITIGSDVKTRPKKRQYVRMGPV